MTDTDATKKGRREMLEEGFAALTIPGYMQGAILNYVVHRRRPGAFLVSALTNNLLEAVNRADPTNRAVLQDWMQLLYNHTPGTCWGSSEAVEAWLAGRED